MKLYLISQHVRNGYDTYDSAVVAAADEYDAIRIHPGDENYIYDVGRWWYKDHEGVLHNAYSCDWASRAEEVQVEYLGVTNREAGLVLASFNAG